MGAIALGMQVECCTQAEIVVSLHVMVSSRQIHAFFIVAAVATMIVPFRCLFPQEQGQQGTCDESKVTRAHATELLAIIPTKSISGGDLHDPHHPRPVETPVAANVNFCKDLTIAVCVTCLSPMSPSALRSTLGRWLI
jgi:hypothetical protein